MTKQVILVTDAHDAQTSDIISCLQSANIAVTRRSLDQLDASCDQERWLAILFPIGAEETSEQMRLIVERGKDFLPGVPVVACRSANARPAKSGAVTNEDLKAAGFRVVADSAAQLPAIIRQLEDCPATGELKPLPEFDRRPSSAALALPPAADSEQTRDAFVLTASLHLAKNQEEAGRIALAGLARLVAAAHWSIFLVVRTPRPEAVVLQHFVTSSGVVDGDFSLDQNPEPAAEAASAAREPSKAAYESANNIEKVSINESGQFLLALPLLSEDILVGVLELIRDEKGFSDSEIALLDRLTIPIAAALQNSVRISDAERLSHTDDLTQLHNARYLRQFLVNETKRARRYNSNLAAVFLDLDDFKRVNDLHGHLVGSHVLMEVAALILPSVRDTDCVVRYGGDEFVVILPETALDEAIQVAERVRSKLEGHRFSGGRRLKLGLTASFGIAVFPLHASSPQQLIAGADSAMYDAKANGKNCVRTSSGIRIQAREEGKVHLAAPFLKIPDEKLI